MEIKLDKRYPLEVSIEQAWAVLSDIHATAACMPGAAITEQVDGTQYKGTVRSKVGPAVMHFGGLIEVKAMDPASKSMQMKAKGADKSGSSATMDLTATLEPGAVPGSSVLVGTAVVTVSGKLAQFGGRLLMPASDAMLSQFADNFRSAAAAVVASVPVAEQEAPAMPGPAPTSAEPHAPGPANELNALALMWTVFKGWLAGFFSKRA